MDLFEQSHRRFNPLTREWVLVSPHRAQRPWQGQLESVSADVAPKYDPACYLCPGNTRAGGVRNPSYDSTFVFTNDFAALQLDVQTMQHDESGKGLLVAESEAGICKVVCFSPRHDLTLSRMSIPDITNVVNVWVEQYVMLGALPLIHYVQIFENRGEAMGCSNPHPHGQIWANHTIPNEPLKEQESQKAYAEKYGACLLCEALRLETSAGSRVVFENEHFVALVPYWAIWPFETMIVAKSHMRDLSALDHSMRVGLAETFKQSTTRYDNLFDTSFPYSMGFHQAPTDGETHPEWHLHIHFYPPLLRSATIRKFMVGYEMLAGPQRDITPETAAEMLRNLSSTHHGDSR